MKYDMLKIENQLCFPLYVCSKEIIKKYTPYLDAINLTYTQYITMMVLWDRKKLNIKEIGEILYLDSGTLTPLLKKLEKLDYIKRTRSSHDERTVIISITKKGEQLRNKAIEIPNVINQCLKLTEQEKIDLYKILYKIMEKN